MFTLTETQKETLKKFLPRLREDKEIIDWHNGQKESSHKIRLKLTETGFDKGQDLTLTQLYEIGDLLSVGLGNTALAITGSCSMFEANDLKSFNKKLRDLLFSSSDLVERVNAFLYLKYVRTMTVSQFLCKFDPEKYPFFFNRMIEVFDFLSFSSDQFREAEVQSIQEFDLKSKNYHEHTYDYFKYFVILREIRKQFDLLDYLETQNLLWLVYGDMKEKGIKILPKKRERVASEEFPVAQVDLATFVQTVNLGNPSDFQPHVLKNPERIKISQIMTHCSDRTWVLPQFQRYFSWKIQDLIDFLKAILNDYYVGAFLLWDSAREPEVQVQSIKGVENKDLKSDSVILDGQQRITSLYYAIAAPSKPEFENSPYWEDTEISGEHPIYFYVNLDTFFKDPKSPDLVEVHRTRLSKQESFRSLLFPLYELERYDEWVSGFCKFIMTYSKDIDKVLDTTEVIRKKLSHMWSGYEIPYIVLPKEMKIDQVTEIFEQLNTKGRRLNVFDLLIARLYKYGIRLKDLWDAKPDSTAKKYRRIFRYSKWIGSKIPIYVLTAISLFYDKNSSAKRSDILDIYDNIYANKEYSGLNYRFEDHWTEFSDYLDRTIERMENMREGGFGVRNEKAVPYAPMIPVLAALLRLVEDTENKADCYKKIRKWYWSSVFTNSYSQAAETQMTTDFREMKEWFKDNQKVPKTVKKMYDEISRLKLLEIHSEGNSKYRAVMSMIALAGAKDLDTRQPLENAIENDKHHIFPRSGADDLGFGSSENINSVLNMTWMSSDTNKKIKDFEKPSAYVNDLIEKKYEGDKDKFLQVLETHLISKEAFTYMQTDRFEDFLIEREKTIVSKLKEYFEIEDSDKSTLMTPETPFSNRMKFWETLRSCQGYIHWVDKYFSNVGLEIIGQSSLDPTKVREIKIIMSKEKADENFRELFKHLREELKNKGITCEARVISTSETNRDIHDRWIFSQNRSFNVTSPDIMARGQYTEIKETKSILPFGKWWNDSKDVFNA
jgi:Fe2+ transport system protein FeoA